MSARIISFLAHVLDDCVMNEVPILFYEALIESFQRETVVRCCKLSGSFGVVCCRRYEMAVEHSVTVDGGQIRYDSLYFAYKTGHGGLFLHVERRQQQDSGEPVVVKQRTARISICARVHESSMDPAVIDEVIAATKGKNVELHLFTVHLSDELKDCIASMRIVSSLYVYVIDEHIPKKLEFLVQKETLAYAELGTYSSYDVRLTPLVMELYTQPQFRSARLAENCYSLVEELVEFWSRNAPEMGGKYLRCTESAQSLRSSNLGFRVCTEAEFRDRCSRYPVVQGFGGDWSGSGVESFILRNDEGAAMYWFFSPKQDNLMLFD